MSDTWMKALGLLGAIGGAAWLSSALGVDLFTENGFFRENSEIIQGLAGAGGIITGLAVWMD